MKAVVDTNVIAYFLLGTPRFVEEARGFFAELTDAWAPALWEAELANALWMATRNNVLTLDDAASRLTLADGLGIHSSRPSTPPCSRHFRISPRARGL